MALPKHNVSHIVWNVARSVSARSWTPNGGHTLVGVRNASKRCIAPAMKAVWKEQPLKLLSGINSSSPTWACG